jgi:hypothetical protein
MAVKPNEGTYAQNALKWGVSGLNIDGGRIGTEKHIIRGGGGKKYDGIHNFFPDKEVNEERTGRFPANLVLSCCCDEVIEGEEETISIHDAPKGTFAGGEEGRGSIKNYRERSVGKSIIHTNPDCPCYMLDKQQEGVSRFFYQAKASRSERNMGCEGLYILKDDTPQEDIEDIKHLLSI